jgi:Collagen triple helix repeat (20 copies)
VKNGSLRAADFKPGQIPAGSQSQIGERGPQGDRGPEGERGLQGERGAKGEQGAKGVEGDAGPQGPSDAYYTLVSGDVGDAMLTIGPASTDHVVHRQATAQTAFTVGTGGGTISFYCEKFQGDAEPTPDRATLGAIRGGSSVG